MWKPCKSNHNWSGEITSVLGYNSSVEETSPECDCLFHPQVPCISNKRCCTCAWSMLVSFVMKREHTMQDYQFHAQLESQVWVIPAAHTVVLLSESLLSPARPISAGLSCWTSSYWAKDWKWERRDWAKEREGSERRETWQKEKRDSETGGQRENERMTERGVRERSCRANRKHRERWSDGFDLNKRMNAGLTERLPREAKDVVEGEDSSALLLAIPGVIFSSRCWLVPEHISWGEN